MKGENRAQLQNIPSTVQDKEAENIYSAKAAHFIYYASKVLWCQRSNTNHIGLYLPQRSTKLWYSTQETAIYRCLVPHTLFARLGHGNFFTQIYYWEIFVKRTSYSLFTENRSRKRNIEAAQSLSTLLRVKPKEKKCLRSSFMCYTWQNSHIRFQGLCSHFPLRSIFSFHCKRTTLASEETSQTEHFHNSQAHPKVKLKKITLGVCLCNFSH